MRRRLPPLVFVVLAVVASACSSSKPKNATSSTSKSGTPALPATIKVTAVEDLTGSAGLAGSAILAGMQFAAQEVNSSGTLGTSKIEITSQDTASNQQQAVSLVTAAAASDALVVMGPALSNEGLAVAPVAQQKGVPYVATQENAQGIPETGDFIFRLTAPQDTYQNLTIDYLGKKGYKSVALVYASNVATNVQWAEQTIPALLNKASIKLADSEKIQTTTTDFTAIAAKIAAAKPDAVGISTVGAQNSTIVTQLRQQGYKGAIFGQQGFSGGTLKAAGAMANDAVWASDFSAQTSDSAGQKFVSDWKAAKGSAPSNFNAEGYDAVQFLALALKAAPSATRDGLKAGMATVAAKGFTGAVGPIHFEGRDERIGGVLLTWQTDHEALASS